MVTEHGILIYLNGIEQIPTDELRSVCKYNNKFLNICILKKSLK